MRARTTSRIFGSVLNGAEMVGVLSILLAGFLLVRSEAITLGAATAAALYFTRLFSPLMMCSTCWTRRSRPGPRWPG